MTLIFSGLLLQAGQEESSSDIRALIERLKSENLEERSRAVLAIKKLGPSASDELQRAAQSADLEVRAHAQVLLRRLDISKNLTPKLRSAFPGIEDRLAEGAGHTWTEALLGAIELRDAKWAPEDLNPLVVRAFQGAASREDWNRVASAAGDWKLRSASPELIKRLESTEAPDKYVAIYNLGMLGAREAWPHLVRRLTDDDEQDRKKAASVLWDLQAHEAIPEVAKLLSHAKADIRSLGVRLLRWLHFTVVTPDPRIVNAIETLLEDPDPGVRAESLETLGSLGVRGRTTLVLRFLKDPKPEVRANAAQALGALGDPSAVSNLLLLLKDQEGNVRYWTIRSLGHLGAREAFPSLRSLLQDPDSDIREAAAESLGLLGDRESAAIIGRLAGDGEASVRRAAIVALGRLQAKHLTGKITLALADRFHHVQMAAVGALRDIRSEDAVPSLTTVVGDATAHVRLRCAAIEVLADLEARETQPHLTKLLQHPSEELRIAAAQALCQLGSSDGVPLLLEKAKGLIFLNALRHPKVWVRLKAEPRVEAILGTGKDMLDVTAQKASIDLSWSQEVLGRPRRWIVGRRIEPAERVQPTMLEVLINYADSEIHAVLEPSRITMMSGKEAHQFWVNWWQEKRK